MKQENDGIRRGVVQLTQNSFCVTLGDLITQIQDISMTQPETPNLLGGSVLKADLDTQDASECDSHAWRNQNLSGRAKETGKCKRSARFLKWTEIPPVLQVGDFCFLDVRLEDELQLV